MNQPVPSVVRIKLGAEIDIFGKQAFAALLAPAERAGTVILDLSDTIYLDASALGSLVHLRNEIRKRGKGVVYLINVSLNIRKTFSVTGLDRFFVINAIPNLHANP